MLKSYSFIEQTNIRKLVSLNDERIKEIKSNDSDVSSPNKFVSDLMSLKLSISIFQNHYYFHFVPIIITATPKYILSLLLLHKRENIRMRHTVWYGQCSMLIQWVIQSMFEVTSKRKLTAKRESKIEFHHWIQFVCTKILAFEADIRYRLSSFLLLLDIQEPSIHCQRKSSIE